VIDRRQTRFNRPLDWSGIMGRYDIVIMGVDHRVDRGTSPPPVFEVGT